MSLAAMSEAWSHSSTKGGTLLVLLAVSDQANEEALAWATEDSLVAKSRMSDRHVRRAVAELCALGELEAWEWVEDRSGLRRNCYRITVGELAGRRGTEPDLALAREGTVRKKDDRPSCPRRPDKMAGPRASAPIEGKPITLKEAATPPRKSEVEEVYRYWRERRGKTRSTYERISEARRKKIATRLDDFSVEDLKRAIDGVGCDPWVERAKHDDVTIIFRSHEQVEKFLDLADSGPTKRGLTPQEIARRAIELEEEEAA